jgi:hypothetical protein
VLISVSLVLRSIVADRISLFSRLDLNPIARA